MRVITFADGTRFYECNDTFLPSVTTVLAATRTKAEREKLEKWQLRVGIDEAMRIREEAQERGLALHGMIESFFAGKDIDCPEPLLGIWSQAKKVLQQIPAHLASELTVTQPKDGYAGTLDLLASWQTSENLTLFDFKTSSSPKRRAWIKEHFLQISAYIKALEYAEFEGIVQGMVVVLTDDNFQLFSLGRDEIEQQYQIWLKRLKKYYQTTSAPFVA